MIRNLDFDGFADTKTQPGLRIFLFLLENEMGFVEKEFHWLNFLMEEINLVRLTKEEFNLLDIGIHPKLIITKDGNEAIHFNGLPSSEILKKLIERAERYESKRSAIGSRGYPTKLRRNL